MFRPIVIAGVFVLAIVWSFAAQKASAGEPQEKAPTAPETGDVGWNRGFDRALEDSAQSGKPVFALFQEVPGCAGCKKFGQIVLRRPLIVEAIETEFIPVLIYNNRSGKDAEILEKYREPSWNFQVIRFFDSKGQDVIPRRDRVWTAPALVERMIQALEKHDRKVPGYLRAAYYAEKESELQQIVFAQYCFWTGEQKLGLVPGVVKTEAGHYQGREVTRVWYDPKVVNSERLIPYAKSLNLADGIYSGETFDVAQYHRASESDQKRQLLGTELRGAKLTDFQLTKINSYYRVDREAALDFLSPRQRRTYRHH